MVNRVQMTLLNTDALFLIFRNVGGNFTTIPKYFKNHGYKSIGMGKIFHYDRRYDHNDFSSWDEYYYPPNYCYWQVRIVV